MQRNYIITSGHCITLYFATCQGDCHEIISLRVVMALEFISLHVSWIATTLLRVDMAFHCISFNDRWIATKLYYYQYSWHYTLFPYLSALLQQKYIITVKHGNKIYFLTSQVDCNEIILLRVVMALHFISLHDSRIPTKLYY